MNLLEAIKDLCYRMHVVETKYNVKINLLRDEIEKENSHYNKLKGKEPNLWFQGLILLFMVPFCLCFGVYLFNDGEVNNSAVFVTIMAIVTVAAIILNAVRAKAAYAVRKKRAETWWEKEGKNAVMVYGKIVDETIEEGNKYLIENPLVYEIPESYRTEDDCYALYKIILQRRAFSIEEALSVYADDINAAHQRWMDKYEENKRWEELSERQAELQRTLEQTNQELAYSELMLDEIRIRHKYGD